MRPTEPSLLLATLVFGILYIALLWFISRRLRFPALARTVLVGLTAIEIIIVLMFQYSWVAFRPGFDSWFVHLGSEYALGPIYSATQLLAVGVVALMVGVYAQVLSPRLRAFWLFVGALFAFLNLDEYHRIHERFPELAFAGAAVVGIAIIIAGLWLSFRPARAEGDGWRKHGRELGVFALILFGFVMMGGSIIYDALFFPSVLQFSVEEFLEMSGVTLVFAGFLTFAHRKLNALQWRRTKIAVGGVALLWLFWLVSSFWIFPTIENRFQAQPVTARYEGGRFDLMGYTLREDALKAGETLNLHLYWRMNEPTPTRHGVSVHLLSVPDAKSVVQHDSYPTPFYESNNWLPGVVVRHELTLDLPDDLPQQSYWIQVNLWADPFEDLNLIDVSDAGTGWLLKPDTLILTGIAALDDSEIPQPPQTLTYPFADDFTLSGMAIPSALSLGDNLTMQFWWQITGDVGDNYTQFIHLFDDSGEFIAGYDRQPFNGRFLTSDWVAGKTFVDEWTLDFSEDLPAGSYQIRTGLYQTETVQRLPVSGDAVQDNIIPLTTIQLE